MNERNSFWILKFVESPLINDLVRCSLVVLLFMRCREPLPPENHFKFCHNFFNFSLKASQRDDSELSVKPPRSTSTLPVVVSFDPFCMRTCVRHVPGMRMHISIRQIFFFITESVYLNFNLYPGETFRLSLWFEWLVDSFPKAGYICCPFAGHAPQGERSKALSVI